MLPVNEIFLTTARGQYHRPPVEEFGIDPLGFEHSSFATSTNSFWAVTTLITPFGTPALVASSAKASAVNGVSDAGFMIVVQPAASAAPSLRVIIADGKFQGVRIDLYGFASKVGVGAML